MIHASVESALKELANQETSHHIHRNIATCPRIELIGITGGRGASEQQRYEMRITRGAAKYYARWMGEGAARRDHLSRMAKELKQTDGGWGR